MHRLLPCLRTSSLIDSILSTCVDKLNLVDRRVRVTARRDALGYAVTEFSPSDNIIYS